MDATKVQAWLEELRHGNYLQGKEELVGEINEFEGCNTHTTYCCLGVAAVHVLGRDKDDLYNVGYLGETDMAILGLNYVVTAEEEKILKEKWCIDLKLVAGAYFIRQEVCVQANDRHDMNFEEIAQMIEEMGWHKEEVSA